MKKLITVVVPTYNEELNVKNVWQRVTKIMEEDLQQYDYEILYVDNCSTDATQSIISELAVRDNHVKAIFNARNFGYVKNVYYAVTQAKGDCAFLLHADLQNPPEKLVQFVRYWEEGYKVIVGVKKTSKENKLLFALKSLYYHLMNKISDSEMIEQLTDFGLYDRKFLDVLKNLDDTLPYFKGIVSELGFDLKVVEFDQNDREKGKSFTNFFKSYDYAMLGITTYTKLIRAASWAGLLLGLLCVVIAIITFVLKILNWTSFPTGVAAICIGVFFIGAMQMFFLGLLGEYVICINTRLLRRPLVIEEKRIRY